MKRLSLYIVFSLFIVSSSLANHITGGEMSYRLVNQTGNNFTYHVILKLFRDPASATQLDPTVNIAIYNKGTNSLVSNNSVARGNVMTLTLTSPGPCVVNPPVVSYEVGFYEFDITLPGVPFGYVITYARCCRIAGITNVVNSSSTGVTYTAEIPGNGLDPNAPANNSASFLGVDTVIMCAGYPITYNFGATDNDGDQLVYRFCDGFTNTGGTVPNPPAPPPYNPLPYQAPYSGISPMGAGVTLNTSTGLITGNAPPAGIYVVTVCVDEFRNGQLIATQRKDLQVKVADCDIATVTLNPNGYINCNDYTVSFSNLTPSALINSYFWDFGDMSTLSDTSNIPAPSYTYPDTGIYIVKVVANRNQPCSDSTTAQVRVYPGFFPDFSFNGACVNNPVQFMDNTNATYGNVNFWRWDFGVAAVANDTARQQNPQYTYTAAGNYNVEFIVGSDKGCRDTINQLVPIIDKPPINLTFRDTLICSIDTIQLLASGTGAFTWSPNYNISSTSTSSPMVSPDVNTWYYVDLDDSGCLNRDSLQVRVVNNVTLTARTDTTICLGDQVQMSAATDGLQYSWSPAGTLSNPNILNPIATPGATTTYQITSHIGGCTSVEDVVVTVVPYPTVNAGNDVMICFNGTTQLNGQHSGTNFTWSPSATLTNPNTLNPVAAPTATTPYILTVTDNSSGCPKPARDTVIVTVLPKVNAFAGRDTIIVAGQPLQLRATGGTSYIWSPSMGLNNPNIANPVAQLDGNVPVVTYKVVVSDQAGCTDSAFITVNVFKIGPDILVPTGFTPNGDGRNDVFRPIYAGIDNIDYFRVYNRWGQLVYSNNQNNGQGWDGNIGGKPQNSGVYVWMVRGTDFNGKIHEKRGTVMLIR